LFRLPLVIVPTCPAITRTPVDRWIFGHLTPEARHLFRAETFAVHPFKTNNLLSKTLSIVTAIMSFSSLVQDLSLRDSNGARRPQIPGPRSSVSTLDDRASHVSRAMSYTSTAATSVSISGDISSQLHGGYFHPLARSWQAERQLTKVCSIIEPLVTKT
jgi:hypothetical protein